MESNIVHEFSQLLEKHFRTHHAVSDYAGMLNISPKTLSKQLSKSKGKSPSDFIKERLVLEAKRELNYSNLSVKEIAYQLQFDAPNNFNNFFKKHTQQTPGAFRKQALL